MKVTFVTSKPHLAETINQWITPAFPEWFKELKVTHAQAIENDHKTARHCPAFVHLFKNAHLLRAPQDFSLHLNEAEGIVGSRQPNDFKQMSVGAFNFATQMGEEWSNIYSVKCDFNGSFVPEDSVTAMFFDPIYHQDSRLKLTTMTGVWPMHPTLFTHVAVNMMGRSDCFDERGFMHVQKGAPLAYLYWPSGKPSIEPKVVSQEEYERDYLYVHEHFQGDFVKREKELAYAV